MESTEKLICPIGINDGEPVSADVKRLPHLLIAGGKNGTAEKYLYGLLLSLIKENSPRKLRLLLTFVENIPEELPHLLTPPINDANEAENAFLWAREETDRRFELISAAGVRNIDDYNASSEEKLSYLLIVCGCLEKLGGKAKENAAMLAAKARAAGIYLIACAELCDPKVISGILKANIPSRIAFKTQSNKESRLILDGQGAETLGENQLLFMPVGTMRPQLLTFETVSAEDAENILNEARKHDAPPRKELKPQAKTPSLLLRALRLAVENDGITTALLQRSFGLSYAKAAKLMDEMETAGYVGEYKGPIPRAVLITRDRLEEIEKELL